MKIIIAKRSGLDETVYINATRISSYHASKNPYDGRIETKIYFPEGKCEIEGDKCYEICCFMSNEGDCGVLDLYEGINKSKSFWDKKEVKESNATE